MLILALIWSLEVETTSCEEVMLINVDVIYFASLVKYFGDTEDKSTEKESIKVNIIFKKTISL